MEPLRADRADEAWPNLDDERMWLFFPDLRPRSLEELRATYARRERGFPGPAHEEVWENWLARDRTTGRLIGDAQATISPQRSVALIAYSTYAAYQRNGYARETVRAVIEHLRTHHAVHRAVAEIAGGNAASYRLIESLGFIRTKATDDELTYERLLG